MEISKQKLQDFFKLLTQLSKHSNQIAIIDGVTTIPIQDGCIVINMNTENFGFNNFSCQDLKMHLKNLKPFITSLQSQVYNVEDNEEYILFDIDGFEYPIEKRDVSFYKESEIDMIKNFPKLGELNISSQTLQKFISLLKSNKDNIERIQMIFNEDWEISKIVLRRLISVSEIDITLTINSSSQDKYILSSNTFFENMIEIQKDSNTVNFGIYQYQTDEYDDTTNVFLVHEEHSQIAYQQYKCDNTENDFTGRLF